MLHNPRANLVRVGERELHVLHATRCRFLAIWVSDGMKTKYCLGRDANTLPWDVNRHESAGGETYSRNPHRNPVFRPRRVLGAVFSYKPPVVSADGN